MREKIIVRTISNLSFAGAVCSKNIGNDEVGLLLKLSDESNVKVWIPRDEIESIIEKNGVVTNGDNIKELI